MLQSTFLCLFKQMHENKISVLMLQFFPEITKQKLKTGSERVERSKGSFFGKAGIEVRREIFVIPSYLSFFWIGGIWRTSRLDEEKQQQRQTDP